MVCTSSKWGPVSTSKFVLVVVTVCLSICTVMSYRSTIVTVRCDSRTHYLLESLLGGTLQLVNSFFRISLGSKRGNGWVSINWSMRGETGGVWLKSVLPPPWERGETVSPINPVLRLPLALCKTEGTAFAGWWERGLARILEFAVEIPLLRSSKRTSSENRRAKISRALSL